MKKIKLLLAFCALLIGWSNASAQSWTGNAPADQKKFYLYNVGAQKFINNGDPKEDWGTNAYLQAGFGMDITFELSNGAYNLNTNVSNGGNSHYLATSTWCDGAATPWTFTAVDGQANTYTISNGTSYLVANNDLNDIVFGDLTGNNKSWWKLVSLDDFKAAMNAKEYSPTDPMDVSVFIQGRSFARNDGRNSSWITTHTGGNWTWIGGSDNKYYGNESWNNTFDVHQEIAGLPEGTYELKCSGFGTNGTTYIYATTGGATTQKLIQSDNTTPRGTNAAAKWTAIHEDNAFAGQTTGTFVVGNGNLTVGIKRETNKGGDWCIWDEFRLYYYGLDLSEFATSLATAVSNAEALNGKIPTAAYTALHEVVETNNKTYTSASAYTTAISNISTATTNAEALIEPFATFNILKGKANAIAEVEYTETTSGGHSTFTGAISTQTSTVDGATTVETITTAISTLKTAIKTYMTNAEPKNEGEYFDITCLIENPSFEKNDKTGWSGTTPNAISYGSAEFFNMNFDFYQDITGLANGSYQLNVQAYCRPGDNGSASSGAYYNYTQGISNITSELYVNSDASTIGNIYSYKGNTEGAKVVGNDFHCNIAPDDYWVPNNMQGASLYFADGAYNTSVAALVEDGNLKIGFREASKKPNQWVIFDNFRLYYYGSSKLVYYKQYLPQLKAEVTADLTNLAYKSAFESPEYTALDEALKVDPASETEEAYKTVIDNIKSAQTAFRDAASAYSAFNEAKAIVYAKDKPYASESKYAAIATAQAATATSGPDAVTKTNAIYSAYRKYVESNALAEGVGGIDKTNLIEDANFSGVTIAGQTAGAWAFSQTGGTASIFNGESFTDGDGNANYSYFDYNNNGANNQNLSQTLTALPKGQYLLTVTARATSAMDGNYYLSVDFDEKSATEAIPAIGNTGGTFGRGWNDVSVVFNHVSDGDVTIHVYGQNGKAGWSGATRFRLAKIDKEVSITSSIGVATLYTPYALDFEGTGLSAYTATVEVDEVVVTKVDNVQANTGVILKGAQGNYNIPLAASSSTGKGELTGNATEATAWDAFDGYDIYVLAMKGDDNAQFQKATSGSVAAGKAFLKISKGSNVKVFNIVDGTATGVEAPEVAEAEEEEILYNTAGVRVGKDYKGIVINQKGEKRLQK